MIPVVDIFAGPGGLGEGFASFRLAGRSRFRLALSIENDPRAHETLRLRAFWRLFGGKPPSCYWSYLRGECTWKGVTEAEPEAAAAADAEAAQIELGPGSVATVRARIKSVVPKDDRWLLIGGPPCQAYSLVGRARNRGKKGYVPELDHRQTLYVEYLQILADHAPPVFVMENVKGLLSAQFDSTRLFDRIRTDLNDPSTALKRERRRSSGPLPRYELHALAPAHGEGPDDPRRYVMRSEEFGVPQRRHRVILVGVRSDVTASGLRSLSKWPETITLADELKGLPRVRSGLSKGLDGDREWYDAIRGARTRNWLDAAAPAVRSRVKRVLHDLSIPRASRGAEILQVHGHDLVLNHCTRGHILADLDRYLFASCFADVYDRSPVLADFPSVLLPAHANVGEQPRAAIFADRFRVQLGGEPATTITSHISKDGHYYIHFDPSQCRSLTVREAACIQTFPRDYFFCGPRTSQYQQVGNAVPPRLARQIAEVVARLF